MRTEGGGMSDAGSSNEASHGSESAINNALSRVGQPLIGAVLFIFVSASFYASLGSQVPGLDTDDPAVRTAFPPLNQPTADVPPEQAEAAKTASVEAFRVASLGAVVLLVGGAAANYVGLRGERSGSRSASARAPAEESAAVAR